MALSALKASGAGYDIAAQKFSNKLSVKSPGSTVNIVTFQTAHKDTQIAFHFDDSYPSRVPKIVVHSPTLSRDQKYDLCVLLQRKGKTEEYSNTPLLPLLLEHAIKWLKENYGKSVSPPFRRSDPPAEIREESWQLTPGSIPDQPVPSKVSSHRYESPPRSKTASDRPIKQVTPEPKPVEKKKKSWKKFDDTNFTSDMTAFTNPLPDPSKDDEISETDSWGLPVNDSWGGVAPEDWNADDDSWTTVPSKYKPQSQSDTRDTTKFTMDTVPEISVKEDTRRANYFVAIRCTNSDIGDAVESTVEKILEMDSVYEPICYNRNEVHVTLTTVALHTDAEVEAAVKALEDAREILENHAPQSLLTVSGIDNFQGSKVVFGKVKVMEDVLLLRKVIRWAFKKAGIAPRDNYDYHPHMTIVKTNMTFTKNTTLKTIARSTYERLQSTYFGQQRVKAIHLCKMGKERGPDGFYISPTKIVLKK